MLKQSVLNKSFLDPISSVSFSLFSKYFGKGAVLF